MATVAIVGGGFGGLACAQALAGSKHRVVLIDKRNYHLFQPLLYQVATAALSPAHIASPLRHVLARYDNVEVRLGNVTGIDVPGRKVLIEDEPAVDWDRLVLATGATYSWFGHDDWAEIAPGLKTLTDARTVRAKLLRAFELAEIEPDPDRQRQLTTCVIVGGGPTGVELAGAVAELARWTLKNDFRRIDPRRTRILLIEAGPRVLAGFPDKLSVYAVRALEALGVTVRTGQAVTAIDNDGVSLGNERIPAATVLWAAGMAASPAARWLGVPADKAGRLTVNPDLSVPDRSDVYALGDTVVCKGADGSPLPGLAQVAQQQGTFLGRALRRNLTDGTPMPPFRFHNRGNTAVIGRHAAVFDFGWWRFTGRLAWFLWGIIHIVLLIGFENRVIVGTQWIWNYFTRQRGARLIE
jgi:NADH:quinone reductase (non-electrogenic)